MDVRSGTRGTPYRQDFQFRIEQRIREVGNRVMLRRSVFYRSEPQDGLRSKPGLLTACSELKAASYHQRFRHTGRENVKPRQVKEGEKGGRSL